MLSTTFTSKFEEAFHKHSWRTRSCFLCSRLQQPPTSTKLLDRSMYNNSDTLWWSFIKLVQFFSPSCSFNILWCRFSENNFSYKEKNTGELEINNANYNYKYKVFVSCSTAILYALTKISVYYFQFVYGHQPHTKCSS